MRVTLTYDRGDHRAGRDVEVTSGPTLESLLREIHLRNEPVVVTMYGAPDDPDDIPPGFKVASGIRRTPSSRTSRTTAAT